MLDQNSRQADNGNQAETEGNRNDQNQQRSLVDSIVQNVIRYRRLDKVLERPTSCTNRIFWHSRDRHFLIFEALVSANLHSSNFEIGDT